MRADEINIRDPFVFVEDDTMYLVGTTTVWENGKRIHGFLGYSSKDMVNFDGPVLLFKAEKGFWGKIDFWAPEIHKINGKYYMFATFKSRWKRRASQALVCDTPFGDYKPLKKPFTPAKWECLDATIHGEGNKTYTVFCHEWLQVKDGEMVAAPLSDDLCDLAENPTLLFKASEAPWTRHFRGNKNYITDGPYLYELKSGKLLMLWSSFGEHGYAMGMSTSENGIMGPWTHIPEPLFKQNGGHGMVFKFKDKVYVSLHYPNTPTGMERPLFIEVEDVGDKLELINHDILQ